MPSGEPALSSPPTRWSVDELIPFGKYILLNKISSGATAAVYRAKIRGEAGFERLVTIKRILPQMAGDPDFVETFVSEAKVCARLAHSNICPIYELGKVGESLYMASEWVPGKDLRAILARLQTSSKAMPPLAAAFIASRLCDALDYAHGLKGAQGERLNLLHQDLSPANIVVGYEGAVKLLDFGLARATGRAQQTNVDALKQKLGYMSPESVMGTPIDRRSDLFGVGVCLYEMVTGKRLFAGSDDVATLKLLRNATVPPPSGLRADMPEELEMIIMRALARDPEQRWPSAGEMAHALTTFIAAGDPGYSTRNLAELMQSLFEHDRHAEQSKLNTLLHASQDPALMELRRRFFASPSGAAAVAKAEATRKLQSARPPPPNGAFGVAPNGQRGAAASGNQASDGSSTGSSSHISERRERGLTPAAVPVPVPPSPAGAGAKEGALKIPAPLPPAAAAKAAKVPSSPAQPDKQGQAAQADDEALTTYRPAVLETPRPGAFTRSGLHTEAGYNELIRRSGEDDAEPTMYRPEQARSLHPPAASKASDSQPAEGRITQPSLDPVGMSELQNEPTVFELDPAEYLEALVQDEADAAAAPDKQPQPAAAATSAAKPEASSEIAADFESEATNYVSSKAALSGTSAAALALFDAGNSPATYEEDATRIFFSSDGQGSLQSFELPDVPEEDLTMVSPPTPLRIGAATGTANAPPSAAGANNSKALLPAAGRTPTGKHAPVPAAASGTGAAQASSRVPTLSTSFPAPKTRSPMWWVLLAAACVVLIGLVLRTSLGVTLGVRQPDTGNITIRTSPSTDASVRLDGIYRGRAPLRLEGVPAGVRVIDLIADGYAPVKQSVTLEGGAELKETIGLSALPLPAASEPSAPLAPSAPSAAP